MWVDKPAHQDEIIAIYNRDVRTFVIAKEIGVSQRYVQRILAKAVGPGWKRKWSGKAKDNSLDSLRHVIINLMRQEGRDFTKCDLCGGDIPAGKFQLHHTKYDGATYKDLRIVCRACNLSPENQYLN